MLFVLIFYVFFWNKHFHSHLWFLMLQSSWFKNHTFYNQSTIVEYFDSLHFFLLFAHEWHLVYLVYIAFCFTRMHLRSRTAGFLGYTHFLCLLVLPDCFSKESYLFTMPPALFKYPLDTTGHTIYHYFMNC